MLYSLTLAINFIGLLAALWLGLYLVTRGSRRPEAWLSALGLWSLGGYFLNQLLALNPPPIPAPEIRAWLYHLMLFWPRDVFEMGWKGWLLGWLPAYSIAFWFHVTLYMLPGPFTRKRLLAALAGYVLALAGILVKARFSDAWSTLLQDPLYNTVLTLPFYPWFAAGYATFAGLSLFNLARAARSSPAAIPRSQLWLSILAMALVGMAGLQGIVSNTMNIDIPQALTALFLLAALLAVGIGAAIYDKGADLRFLRRDLLFSAAGAAVILTVFFLSQKLLAGAYQPQMIPSILVGCLALVAYSLINTDPRLRPDRLFHHKESRKLGQPQPGPGGQHADEETPEVSERAVELALRNLHNYAYLADSPLSKLRLVNQRVGSLEKRTDTHIVLGKAVSEALAEAVQMLKPSPEEAPSPTPRTWYPYLVLWDAYVECRPNLEIMSRLYISEGTFNRTRKAAIGSVARILAEMEVQAK